MLHLWEIFLLHLWEILLHLWELLQLWEILLHLWELLHLENFITLVGPTDRTTYCKRPNGWMCK